jgi:AAA+ ATPase superfamily predicted ATPase
MPSLERPPKLFDRAQEWNDLGTFVASKSKGPRLGVVYGRRRQGKSFLLRALSTETGGTYHQALEEERTSALGSLARTIASEMGLGVALSFGSWDEAIRTLVARSGKAMIVLDEFPFLVAKAPELPSVIQRIFDDARSGSIAPFRMLLCGSAMSVMSGLLTGARPLRGRAELQLVVRPFDYRTSAMFWGIRDPAAAFLVDAIVGGTPGYRDLLDAAAPERPGALFAWLAAGVLNPSHALFTEADYLLTEDPGISDRSMYQSVLSAVTQGAHTQREIGGRLGRTDQAMQHPLLILERAGFIRRDADVLLEKRPLIRIADPMLRFHHAIIRPDLPRFEARRTSEAWAAATQRFEAQVLGPHFEELARQWTLQFASSATLGGRPVHVGFTQVNDGPRRERYEVDVVAVAPERRGNKPVLLAIGEAKGGMGRRGTSDLTRLEHLRDALAGRAATDATRLLLFSRGGFTRDVEANARRRSDLELVDLERLYTGD